MTDTDGIMGVDRPFTYDDMALKGTEFEDLKGKVRNIVSVNFVMPCPNCERPIGFQINCVVPNGYLTDTPDTERIPTLHGQTTACTCTFTIHQVEQLEAWALSIFDQMWVEVFERMRAGNQDQAMLAIMNTKDGTLAAVEQINHRPETLSGIEDLINDRQATVDDIMKAGFGGKKPHA